MTKLRLLLVLTVLTIGFSAFKASSETVEAEDFTKKASMANLFEIRTSQLALRRSDNSDVKDFAQQMIDDHTKAADGLKEAVADAKISASNIATELDADHQGKLDALENAGGDSFDSQYVQLQVKGHEDAVDLFTNYKDQGKNKALRDFADSTLPTLETHKDHVEKLETTIGDQNQ